MNQNVLNSSNWFSKLGTDLNATERNMNNKAKAVGDNAFQNYLNNQISRSEASHQEKQVGFSSAESKNKRVGVKTILKNVDTTAAKLAVKTPEKVAETMNSKDSTANVNTIDKKTDNTSSESINQDTQVKAQPEEPVAVADVKALEPDVDVRENLLTMLQQLLSQLTETTPEKPESENLIAKVEQLIQSLTQMTGELPGKKELKLTEKIEKVFEKIVSDTESNKAMKPEIVEALKSVLKEMKQVLKPESEKGLEFSKVLAETKDNASELKQVPSQSSADTSANGNTEGDDTKSANNKEAVSKNGNAFGKSEELGKSQNDKTVHPGKEKNEVRTQIISETKSNNGSSVVAGIHAKGETSMIAFGKTEMTNQAARTALQQNIMDQITNSPKMVIKQTEQGAMMTLKLNPDVLGNVEIKMEIIKGVLQAEISVENMIVKGAIDANLSDLKNALSDKGYQVESLNVSVGQESHNGKGQQHQQQDQHSKSTDEEFEMQPGQYGFEAVVKDTQIDYKG